MTDLEATRFILKDKRKYNENPLLAKNEIGHSKRTTYDLPKDPEHSFGVKNVPDKEGAGKVILTWKEHTPNPDSVPGRDFLKLNKMSVKDKALTPQQVNEYRKTHDARRETGKKHVAEKANPLPSHANPEHTYGIKTKYNEDIKELVESRYEDEWVKEQNVIFESLKTQDNTRKAKMQHNFNLSVSPTRHSQQGTPEPDDSHQPFKMKKFLNVGPKVDTNLNVQ
jgi:hypothetical protein